MPARWAIYFADVFFFIYIIIIAQSDFLSVSRVQSTIIVATITQSAIVIYITLETIYSGLSKSNFKDHYGDAVNNVWVGLLK